ncbi:MAG: oligoendopeptidase F [Candidatus Zixiibacteriota bacterium]
MVKKASGIFVLLVMGLVVTFTFNRVLAQSGTKTIPQRSDIDAKYKWKLEDIYATDQLWEEDFAKVEGLLPKMLEFKNRLSESGKTLLECLQLQDSLWNIVDRLYVYSGMRFDEDTRVSTYQEMSSRARSLATRVEQAVSFVDPEILAMPQSKLDEFMKSEKGLRLYQHYIDNIIRKRAHTLSPSEEEILALAGDLARAPLNIWTMINDADIKYPSIKDEEGNEVQLTKERYYKFLESTDRRVRKDASDAYSSAYLTYLNTLGATLNGSVAKDLFFAKARKYNSTLEAALDRYNIPVSVFENLIQAVDNNLEPLHKYVSLRKKVLKLEELHKYDLAVPLVPEAKMEIPYDSALIIIEKALGPLGKQYVADMKAGFASGWIDVYETEGKGSGAYSWGCYSSHPYMLLNYNNTLNNMFTVGHEMGHCMHRYYSNKHQPYVYSGHAIFTAEVASITNEALLMDYLLKNTQDKAQKLYLLNHYIDEIEGTFYTQVMFAEFEKAIHQKVENGDALSSASMRKVYRDIFQKFYGPELVLDSLDDLGCLRIYHFYRKFYVYQYATSFAAAVSISKKILEGDKEALNSYLEFLKTGKSDYPINLLKDAGVDMTSPEPINKTIELFASLVDEFERLLLQ